MPAINSPLGEGNVNTPPGAEKIYPSEVKAPSPPIRYRTQASPDNRVYPFPITDMPDTPPTGDEGSREIDGDNPAPMGPGIHHSLNAAGVGNGHVESKRTDGAPASSPKWGGAMGAG